MNEKLPADVQRIANLAFRESRAEGCNCEPNIAMSPLPLEPFWRATVEHDVWCRLVRRLRSHEAPI